jgi:hypothetical protein
MDSLMEQLTSAVGLGAEALFSVGGSVLSEAICEAATDIAAGGSGLYADYEATSVEKEESDKIKNCDEDLKDNDEKLKDPNIVQKDKEELMTEKKKIEENKKDSERKIQNAHRRSTIKSQGYQLMSQGLGAIPKGIMKAKQQSGQADKTVTDSISSQTASSYETARATLRGFLDVDYLAGLVTLGNIQLR